MLPPPSALRPAKSGIFRRLADWLFGYDFFISYAQRDGLNYPVALEKRLESLGYKVFLDKSGYVAGIDLDQATRRRVRMSRKLVVLARPHAFESEWVKREVDVYLETTATPIINVNDALAAAPDVPLSRLAREHNWLRIEEHVAQIDDAPTQDCIDALTRSFNATRQETIRVRFFQGATAAFALVAAVAVWQAVAAIQARRNAETQRDRALATQSRIMATFANQQTDQMTAVIAAPLALEALPNYSAGVVRPYAPEAEAALYKALFVRRDYAYLKAVNPQGKNLTAGVARLGPAGSKTLAYGQVMTSDQPKIWDTRTGRLLSVIGEKADDFNAYFVRSGAALVTASPASGGASLWSADDGGKIKTYPCPSDQPKATGLRTSDDGKRILLLCGGHLVRLVDLDDDFVLDVFRSDQELNFAIYGGDGQKIAVTQTDGLVHVVTIAGGDDQKIQMPAAPKVSGIFSPNGAYLAGAPAEEDAKSQLTVWELQTGKVVASLPARLNVSAALAGWRGVFSPDAQFMLAISPAADNLVRVLAVKDGSEVAVLRGHDGPVMSAVFSPDGQRVITASVDRTARIWDARSGSELATLKGHTWPVLTADVSDDGAWIATSAGGNEDGDRIWHESIRPSLRVEGCDANSAITGVTFSRDGKRLVAFGGRSACVWDVAAREFVARFAEQGYSVESASFSPDGRFVVSASDDKTAAIWSAETGTLYKLLKGHADNVVGATFSPDGKRVLTASWDKTARLWDALTGDPLPITLTHDQAVEEAAFSDDGTHILTLSGDKNIYLWDAASGQPRDKLTNANEVNHAAFSPDGKLVAAATGGISENAGHAAVIWDIGARKVITTLPLDDHAWSVAFSPDGRHLASSAGTLTVWDIATQTAVAIIPPDASSGTVSTSTAFARDGSALVVVTSGSVSLWPHFAKTQDLVDVAKRTMARCLTPRERSAFKLESAPPRWCITGAGRESEKDPAKWAGAWPYDGKAWKDWLVARDHGARPPMPASTD